LNRGSGVGSSGVTGKEATGSGISIDKIADGKIVES
jgi:hypothetical protein